SNWTSIWICRNIIVFTHLTSWHTPPFADPAQIYKSFGNGTDSFQEAYWGAGLPAAVYTSSFSFYPSKCGYARLQQLVPRSPEWTNLGTNCLDLNAAALDYVQ